MARPVVRLTPLVCPACGANLPAIEDDAAFACAPCSRAYELVDQHLLDRALQVVPHPATRSGFHLPFWEWAGAIRVPAFNTKDLAPLAARLSGGELAARTGLPCRLVGTTLGSAEATRVARFAGLPEPAGPPALLAVPFVDEGSHLLDLATGYVLYKESIDRVGALLAALHP
jgi:hypothetical protein